MAFSHAFHFSFRSIVSINYRLCKRWKTDKENNGSEKLRDTFLHRGLMSQEDNLKIRVRQRKVPISAAPWTRYRQDSPCQQWNMVATDSCFLSLAFSRLAVLNIPNTVNLYYITYVVMSPTIKLFHWCSITVIFSYKLQCNYLTCDLRDGNW